MQYDELRCWSCVLDTVVRREETQEAIVPDALDDIATVINVTGTALLQRCTAMEGSVSCETAVDAAVLFAPDDGGRICSLTVQVPIRCVTEAYQVKPEDKVHCSVTLTGLDVKVMNPRKVLVRAEVALRIQVYTGAELRFSTGVKQDDSALQLRQQRLKHCYVVHSAQRSFSYEEGVTVGAGQRKIRQVLHCTGTAYCSEGKVTGARVLLKGGVRVSVRYIGQGEQYTCEQYDIPVSQVLDAGMGREGDLVLGRLTLSDLQMGYYDEGSMTICMELVADCVILQQREMELLTDAYSTQQLCQCRTEEASVYKLNAYKCQLIPFRQSLDVELPGVELVDQTVTLAELVSGGEGSPKGKLKASLCGRDGTGRLLRVEQSCLIDLPCQSLDSELEVTLLECGCVLSATGAELRGSLQFIELDRVHMAAKFLSQITVEDFAAEKGSQPSAILRRLQPGETLWEVAKCCRATVSDIMAVNQISDEGDASGRFLLIPRHR